MITRFSLLVIGMAVTGVIYLVFPICYVIKHGKVGRKKAWIIADINFFSLHIIFTIIAIVIFDAAIATPGPILWLFISVYILKTDVPKEEEEIELCTECGYQMFSEEQECSNCGKKRPIKECQENQLAATDNTNVENMYPQKEIDYAEIQENKGIEPEEKTIADKLKIESANMTPKTNSIKEKLLELNELYEENLVTEEEYNEKRKKIIEQL